MADEDRRPEQEFAAADGNTKNDHAGADGAEPPEPAWRRGRWQRRGAPGRQAGPRFARKSCYLATFSILVGVIHFRLSFSDTEPITVAGTASVHASPDSVATLFLVT